MGTDTAVGAGHNADRIPKWSGCFTRLAEGLGMMLVHVDDRSMPQFPEGWEPVAPEEPLYEGDTVIWLLSEVA